MIKNYNKDDIVNKCYNLKFTFLLNFWMLHLAYDAKNITKWQYSLKDKEPIAANDVYIEAQLISYTIHT